MNGSLVLRAGVGGLVCTLCLGARVPTTPDDFLVPGTQIGDVTISEITTSDNCRGCHGEYDPDHEMYATWRGSLMALGGMDPLFYAQMTTANQDAAEVGTYCMRCHVPYAIVTGNAAVASGALLDTPDRDGVTCHICHSMVDPVYKPGVSPPQDLPILQALGQVPAHYGNAAFVLDPTFTMRGPLDDIVAGHEYVRSRFHTTSEMCGTCHDVGNVATTRQPNGTWRYNALAAPADDPDPRAQFPLESTYTEWRLSTFASTGVDMHGRFGGENRPVVSSCQDCHMPRVTGQACYWGPVRPDLPLHEFAGGAAPILDLIGEMFADDPEFDHAALARGRERSLSMLHRAASLEVEQSGGALHVRAINETGHKLPTGHIEGRRVWVGVRFLAQNGGLVREYGAYDRIEAILDESSTRIYEMHVGLSEDAAIVTGLPPGPTNHMSLADTIEKDNRIPPRGFRNDTFAAAAAPVVGHVYADGTHWDDTWFTIPAGAARAEVSLHYQNLPRAYIEHLREANVTDDWGEILYDLWNRTGRGSPVLMAQVHRALGPFLPGDIDGNCRVDGRDLREARKSLGLDWTAPGFEPRADLDGDHRIADEDILALKRRIGSFCRAGALSDSPISVAVEVEP